MAELLLRVVDKVNVDPYLDVQCLKAGDVVVVCADGHAWGPAELANPEWRIIKVPGVTVLEAEAFLGPEIETDPANPSRMLQRRAFNINLSDARLAHVLAATGPIVVNLTSAQLAALKQRKARRADPNIFT